MRTRPSTGSSSKMLSLQLKANDNYTLAVDEDVACKSDLVRKELMQRKERYSDPYEWTARPIYVGTSVDGHMLDKLMEWCERNRNKDYRPRLSTEGSVKLSLEDKRFLNVSDDKLVDIRIAAEAMKIPGLVDIVNQRIDDRPEREKTAKARRRNRQSQNKNKRSQLENLSKRSEARTQKRRC